MDRLSELLDDRFYKTKGRELENMIPPDILIKTIAKIEKKNEGKFSEKYLTNLKHSQYKNEYLGSFIDESFSELNHSYGTIGSSTIKDKSRFTRVWLSNLRSEQDLGKELSTLAQDILSYIEDHN